MIKQNAATELRVLMAHRSPSRHAHVHYIGGRHDLICTGIRCTNYQVPRNLMASQSSCEFWMDGLLDAMGGFIYG